MDKKTTLKKILEEHPEQKDEILNSMRDVIIQIIPKEKLIKKALFYPLIVEYFENADYDDRETMAALMVDSLLYVIDERSGYNIAIHTIGYASNKDKKKICKIFKDFIGSVAFHPFGHKVLLKLYYSVDDTVLINKTITRVCLMILLMLGTY